MVNQKLSLEPIIQSSGSKKINGKLFLQIVMIFNLPNTMAPIIPKKNKIESALDQYNIYRVNLIRAELKEYTENDMTIFFDGFFCETCGYYDYFEDLQVLLEDEYSINSKIMEIEQTDNGDLVRFQFL